MQSAQEFFESYLNEKNKALRSYSQINQEIHESFFSRDLVEYHSRWYKEQRENPESIFVVEIRDITASFITTQPKPKQTLRYQLRFVEGKWEIYKQELECPMCKGTGQTKEKPCHFCGGIGWKELFQEQSGK